MTFNKIISDITRIFEKHGLNDSFMRIITHEEVKKFTYKTKQLDITFELTIFRSIQHNFFSKEILLELEKKTGTTSRIHVFSFYFYQIKRYKTILKDLDNLIEEIKILNEISENI